MASSYSGVLAFAAVATGVTVAVRCLSSRKVAPSGHVTKPGRSATEAAAAHTAAPCCSAGQVAESADVATVCAHAGVGDVYPTGDVTPAIHLSSTYARRGDLSYVSTHVYTCVQQP